jgi:SAM-dependent methyltransferase
MNPHCPLCDGALAAEPLVAPEMMFGEREQFRYGRCEGCQTLVLLDAPVDLDRYYPPNYYSLAEDRFVRERALVVSARRLRTNLLLRAPPGIIDRLVLAGRAPAFFRWLAGRRLGAGASTLDVGSGAGETLLQMARHGFTSLLGVDPYLGKGRTIGPVSLEPLTLDELGGEFDIVMLNHAFEHMAEPRAVLETVRRRLASRGTAVIRVPVADSWAARAYGTDWVQLDAPRHLVIPTEGGLAAAADAAGLRVLRSFRDGYALQFWGSEQYRLGIPLRAPQSWAENPLASPFTQSQVDAWEAEARALNERGEGDSATFVLTHSSGL